MRRDPFEIWDDMMAMQQAMDRFIDGFLGERAPVVRARDVVWRPLVDVCETEEEVIVTIELPGVRREDVQLIYHDGYLTVSGYREHPPSDQRRWCQQVEIPYGPFERAVRIHSPVDPDQCQARYQNGFLEVVLRKAPQPAVRAIKVEMR
ncbi:MAG: Hsp20/alpha crystallin family protein [Abditibacteriales bacterium]|nr:Hsp20/alpha crystallin family protein [Abditibacteriales bacterium]MDW8367878.1 Hsp20/alpha crystallin family protein [Abditibacteriales bacterium]